MTDESTVNGECSLREAVLAANSNSSVDSCPAGEARPVVDTINIPAGTYVLLDGQLEITDDVDLVGVDARTTIIDANDLDRVLFFDLEEPGGNCPDDVFPASIRHLTIQNGWQGEDFRNGGGVRGFCVDLTVQDCRIMNNEVSGYHSSGGGVSVLGADLIVRNSTFSGNTAWTGGGISLFGTFATITNSTISLNSATGRGGGGVGIFSDGDLQIFNVTIAGNTASNASAILGDWDPPFGPLSGLLACRSVIQGDCDASPVGGYCGHNVESPGDTCGFNEGSDQVAIAESSLGLMALAFNGGESETQALTIDSVAVDVGTQVDYVCPSTDQRGWPREDGLCDAGAYELDVTEVIVFIDGFESGNASAWTEVDSNADQFNELLISRGIGGDYAGCTLDDPSGDYWYLGQTFNESNGGLGGTPITDVVELYWKNEHLASTIDPYDSDDADLDGVLNFLDADCFDSSVD